MSIKQLFWGASAALAILSCASVQAAETIGGPVKGLNTLTVYAKPGDIEVPTSVDVGSVTFPLVVLGKNGDFLKTRLGKREVWLDANEVNLVQAVSFECHKSDAQPKQVGSTKGAIGACK